MSPFRLTRTRSFGLRPRVMALVLAAVAPFVLLIGMVARQHRFDERANAEDAALDQASRLADRLDSRFGAVETLLLTLVHSVSPNPRDSLRNDKLLRDVVKELPKEFAHFAVITSSGVAIGTSDTLSNGKRRPIPASSTLRDTLLNFDIQGPVPLYRTEGPLAIAVSLRVLYMSGYTDDEIVRRGLHDPSMSFIQKPFTADNLAMQVRTVLDAA